MTSLTYQAAMEVNAVLREHVQREMNEMHAETRPASFAERLGNFWASLYATPMPAPRNYL